MSQIIYRRNLEEIAIWRTDTKRGIQFLENLREYLQNMLL